MKKLCYKCEGSKDVSEFHKDSRSSDGLSKNCKECKKRSDAEYRRKNPEKLRERGAEYRRKNRDEINRNRVRSRKENLARYRLREAGYRDKNRDKIKAQKSEYQRKNKDAIRGLKREYYQTNREKIMQRDSEYSKTPHAKETRKISGKKRRDENPLIHRAHNEVARALRTGELIKPKKCEGCGKEKKLGGHHEDYTKPLEVDWLCQLCHMRIPKSN
jgi:hypothetical protein